ncbi:MAG: alpha/beta hydrolase-fold protein [Bacteroidota bacterium]
MKRIVVVAVVSVLLTAIIMFTIFELQAQANQLQADRLEEVDSNILNEKRNLLVHFPNGYDSTKSYPVLYVLDGSSQDFRIARISSILVGAEVMPEVIIVGIPNTNRNRDLTPHYGLQDQDGERYGEADRFLDFISNEAIPHIESKYNTSSYRMLVGHSRAGLFSFYAMLEKPGLFDAHFCFSPAFWRDNMLILSKAKDAINQKKLAEGFLYMSLGTAENDKMKSAYDRMTQLFDGHNSNQIRVEHHYTNGASHGTNLVYSAPHALKKWSDYYLGRAKVE